MPRQSDPIDDRTPLDGPRIDVAARVGWLLRTHRTVAGISLRQMAEALRELGVPISAATLSRVESEGQRSGPVIDGYTAVLGLPAGGLRADVDALCRAFSYAPPRSTDRPEQTLESFSRVCADIDAETVAGGAWLEFAHHHDQARGFGLPTRLMQTALERLVSETARSAARARYTRHEALNTLADGPYGALLADLLRSCVEDPDHQVPWDPISVLSDHPTELLARWGVDLLRKDSLFQVRAGSYMLQGMLVQGGLSEHTWCDLVPALKVSVDSAAADPRKAAVIRELTEALPARAQDGLRRLGVAPGSRRAPVAWSRTRSNTHYALATSLARAACFRVSQPEEPLLARLVFEACFEPRGVRMALATWALFGSPYGSAMVDVICGYEDWPDEASRRAAFRVAGTNHDGQSVPGVEDLLDDETLFGAATIMIGRSGGRLPDDALTRGLAGDETTVRQTLYALGMAGDPRLTALAEEGAQPPAITRAARWWLTRGGRVLV